jgi:hypothetical protein
MCEDRFNHRSPLVFCAFNGNLPGKFSFRFILKNKKGFTYGMGDANQVAVSFVIALSLPKNAKNSIKLKANDRLFE